MVQMFKTSQTHWLYFHPQFKKEQIIHKMSLNLKLKSYIYSSYYTVFSEALSLKNHLLF